MSASSPPLVSDADWCDITETLDGIVHVECPSPFTDLALLCPKEAWLVVDLASARASAAATPSLRHTMTRVLNALTRLVVHVETLRPWPKRYQAFWTRVLLSEMIQNRLELQHDPWLRRGVVQRMRANGTHVAFQWRARRLEPHHVIEPLRKCLEIATIDRPSRPHVHVPVRVALRLEDCQLTSKTLSSVYGLLRIPVAAVASNKTRVFETTTLTELSLSANILHAHVLRDFVHCLHDPATRRIDGLRLDSTVPGHVHQTPTYTAAFRQLIRTITTARHDETEDRGLALSLEDCTIFHARHVDALANGLAHATRPLRGLSLACWQLPDAAARRRFAQLLLTALPTATRAFDLDVSCIRGAEDHNDVERALQDARPTLIEAALPRMRTALDEGRSVCCRLSSVGYVTQDEELTTGVDWKVSSIAYYHVRHITDDHRVQIGVEEERGDQRTGWTNLWILVNVRIDDAYVLRCAPSGLMVDRCTRGHGGSDRVVLELAAVTGEQLTRLSMRQNPWNSQQYVSWCPLLEELNAEGYYEPHYEGQAFWSEKDDIKVAGHSLQVINVASCEIDTATLRTFLGFPNVQSLRAQACTIDLHGLEALYDKLQTSPALAYVDLRQARVASTNPTSAVVRANVARLLQLERCSVETRTVVCFVLRQLETEYALAWSLSGEVLLSILSFLDTRDKRVVVW